MTKEKMQKSNEKFKEFLRLCDSDPERALYEAAKSVVGNHEKDSPIQSEDDKKYAEWAGPHGLYNLRLAVESYMKHKKRG